MLMRVYLLMNAERYEEAYRIFSDEKNVSDSTAQSYLGLDVSG